MNNQKVHMKSLSYAPTSHKKVKSLSCDQHKLILDSRKLTTKRKEILKKMETKVARVNTDNTLTSINQANHTFSFSRSSINFLHLALLIHIFLQRWHVSILHSLLLVDAQPQLQHPVNSCGKSIRIIKAKPRSQQSRLKQQ